MIYLADYKYINIFISIQIKTTEPLSLSLQKNYILILFE